jgi:uncharacterized protein (TIGR00661 family)
MTTRKPIVLVAPLDWGLGHTVRCIPIIRRLQENGCEVLVGCDSKQRLLLIQEFPNIRYINLPGYKIFYGNSRLGTLLKLFFQGPKLLIKINRENQWLRKFLHENRIDAIISDNRYGFFSHLVPCILITHQLQIITGFGKLLDSLIQKALYIYINKFDVCWVPDSANPGINAAGILSHPTTKPLCPLKYIGPLSRFQVCTPIVFSIGVLIILSGPEPQRSIFEQIILNELEDYSGIAVLVRGIYDGPSIKCSSNVTVLNNASTAQLNSYICNAEIVISRAGYTTIMDILKLGKQSILVPTPGQAEQEYLGSYMHQRKLAYTAKQTNFSLNEALKNAKLFVNNRKIDYADQYMSTIEELARSLNKMTVNHPALTSGNQKNKIL